MDRKTGSDLPLKGLRILVVEDEFLIASAIEDTLQEAGADTVRAASVPCALKDIDYKAPSAALLDVRLGSQTTRDVADCLAARDIPFLFYSGDGLPDEMRDRHPDAELLLKPVTPLAIIEAVRKIAARRKNHRL